MGSPNYQARWPQNWDYLVAQAQAQTGTGLLLDGIKAVVRNEFPAIELLPAVGIQYKGTRWEIIGQMQRRTTTLFAVTAIVQVEPGPSIRDLGESANDALRPFANDGSGTKGLEVFLQSLAAVPGQWIRSQITDAQWELIEEPTQASNAIAIIRYTFEVIDQVKGGG